MCKETLSKEIGVPIANRLKKQVLNKLTILTKNTLYSTAGHEEERIGKDKNMRKTKTHST